MRAGGNVIAAGRGWEGGQKMAGGDVVMGGDETSTVAVERDVAEGR